jgi:cation:H+ antiporter
MVNLLIFLVALVFLVKSANLSITHSSHLAKSLRISTHLVGFLVVALISVLPETAISVSSALQGVPAFGLGTLFGSNVADLTLILALVVFFAREIKIRKPILQMNLLFIVAILTPLLLGMDGSYTRTEGVVLMLIGGFFFYTLVKKERKEISKSRYSFSFKSLLSLIASLAVLLISAQLIVHYGVALGTDLQLNPTFIALVFVALGTTLPELFFSIQAVRENHDGLALGDILGTVIIDAVVIVGLIAVITPFSFPPKIIYATGLFMLMGAFLLFFLMKTEGRLSKREACILVVFYLGYALAEYYLNLNGN